MNTLLELVLKALATLVLWLILFPAVIILATPVILTASAFGRNHRYSTRVANGYGLVFDLWTDHGWWIMP